MVAPLLEVEGLVRRYDNRTVVNVHSLALQRGEILGVVGPNGAGKSTLFRLLLQLERADAGTVRLAGQPLRATSRSRLTGVFQRPILFTGSALDNVMYGLRARGMGRAEARRQAEAALHALGLGELARAPVHTLSGGEAQRVALARALVLHPDVLLLDEPTANLDVSVRRQFRLDLEREGRARAGAIILITHDASEAFGLADRIAVMHHGSIVQVGTPAEIMLEPASPFAAELSGAELLLHGVVETRDDALVAVRAGEGVLLWAAASGLDVGDRAVIAYRPEDIVLSATADAPTSAVNQVPVLVRRVAPAGALVRVLLEATASSRVVFSALLTRRSMESLGLRDGTGAVAHMKATALHAWPD